MPARSADAVFSPVVTAQAQCDGDGPDSKCSLTFSDTVITVSGSGDFVATTGRAVTRSKLPFENGFLDNVIYYTSYQDDRLVLFDVSDGDTGWGGVVRIAGADFKVAWHVKIPAFNVGPAALEGRSLYVSGIGFVAHIDVDRGRYVWQHEGLYDQSDHTFNSFDAPVITPTEVLFRESDSKNISRRLKVIRVQKASGEFSIED